MRLREVSLIAALTIALSGCGGGQLYADMMASRARRDAKIEEMVARGSMSPEQAADILGFDHAYARQSDFERSQIGNDRSYATVTPDYSPSYSRPMFAPTSNAMAPTNALDNYTAGMQSTAAPSPHFVPYSAVSSFMPGINPDGTAR